MVKDIEKRNEAQKEKVPPDGGYGWVIVFAYTLASVTAIPIIQNFGLIYKSRLKELEITSTQLTTILALNTSFGQILGVFQGPLLKRLGFRLMAVVGVTFLSIGTVLTTFSESFLHFALTHGVITSIGFTYTLTSFSMAMHSYFKNRRSRASGLVMGFSGAGPVGMPIFIAYSLNEYGVFGTCLILTGLNLHGLIGASLLQPVAKYLKPAKEDDKNEEDEDNSIPQLRNVDGESIIGVEPMLGYEQKRKKSCDVGNRMRSVSEGDREDVIPETNNPVSILYVSSHLHTASSGAINKSDNHFRPDSQLYYSASDMSMTKSLKFPSAPIFASMESLDFHMRQYCPELQNKPEDSKSNGTVSNNNLSVVSEKSSRCPKCCSNMWNSIKKEFDLDLLKDPIYVNITAGISIALIGELMFSLLTPFILGEVGLDLQQTAYFMSTAAISDIIARFFSPYLGEWVKLKSRAMYLMALFFLLISRTSLLFVSDQIGLIAVAIIVGVAKGVRTVYWGLVLPDHVEIKKLGSAMSIQNFVNGTLLFFVGPLVGKIVEINNSYFNVIYVSNALTGISIVLWVSEWLIVKWQSSKQKNKKTSSIKPLS